MSVKITVDRDILQGALAKVARAAPARAKMTILQHIHIRLLPGAMMIRATDLDIEVETTIPAQHDSAGVSILVIADLFSRLVGDMPPGTELTLSWSGERTIELKRGRSRFKVNSLPPDDYPNFPDIEGGNAFTMPAADFRRSLATAGGAMSSEQTRYYLCGVHLHVQKDRLVFVATNGIKLARCKAVRPVGLEECGVIIPDRTVNELLRLIDAKAEGDIEVSVSPKQITFLLGQTLLKSKLIDATFPDYQRVIPQQNNNVAIVDVDELLLALKRINLIADRGEGESRVLRFNFSDSLLTITATNVDAGEGEESISIETDKPFDLEIGFNGHFVAELLAIVGSDTARLRLNTASDPAVIERIGAGEADFVVMPKRI